MQPYIDTRRDIFRFFYADSGNPGSISFHVLVFGEEVRGYAAVVMGFFCRV
jgi:hypothetical protein